jgi:hypothetical protein
VRSQLPSIIAAGLLSGALFYVVASLGLGFLFMFLPTLPLFYVGLGKAPIVALASGFLASGIVSLGGLAIGFFFLIVFALPTYYIASKALRLSALYGWFPLGVIFLNLTAFACAAMGLVTLHYAMQPGGLEQALAEHLQAEFSNMDGEYGSVMRQLTTTWSFLIFAFTIWLWNLTLYAHAWLANRLLRRVQRIVRPNLAIENFVMPNWILLLLGIAALASLIGSPAMQFFGKLSFVALLFPYFLLGMAILHEVSRKWPSRRFFLFFIYLMIFAQFWPCLAIAFIGFISHIKSLSAPPTSSKS